MTWNNRMTPNIYNPPPNVRYCKIKKIEPNVNVGILIGSNGKVLNAITEQTYGIKYIWFHNDSKEIEIWGDYMDGIVSAIKKIDKRSESIARI